MLNKVKFAKEATNEFLEAVEWYELKAKGLGIKLTDEIESTIERIKLNFDLYPNVVENIRKIQVTRFPYSLFYIIENSTLVILRIFHNKRKPIEW
ncbi:MAG: type II toxin-antitoxin system RelE/ParE family toxin [Melioribacteraceae bacterium]|nr:type II toxin-antitoxin system RelE/ParE family toxin [Melioribacteraceae bacterium]